MDLVQVARGFWLSQEFPYAFVERPLNYHIRALVRCMTFIVQ
jgi:hypothetical protein